MGVVIGETAIVGDDVTLYQGVTLGGTGKDIGKRHPTLRNGVFVGNDAQDPGQHHHWRELAGRRRIRGLTRCAADSTVVGVPAHIVFQRGKRVVITDPKQINDPLSEALSAVANEVKELKAQVRELQGREFGPAESDRLQEIIEIDYQI